MTKITYADALNHILTADIVLPADVREKLTQLHGQYTKPKTKGERKPTKTQRENATLTAAIDSFIQPDTSYTVTEIQNGVPELDGLSNQKVSALLKALVDAGKLERLVDKTGTHFQRV